MSDFLTTPITFTGAQDFLAQKVNLPTALSALDLSLKVPARIRAQAFFSAKVASANILQALRTEVTAIARGDYNYATGRTRLKAFLSKQGYGVPDVGSAGERDLTELASTRRLDLILRQNVAMANAVGQREVAELPAVMEYLPCYEYLPSGAEHPRAEHMAFYGLILPKTDPFWATHYPPSEYGCDCGIGQTDEAPNGKTSGFKPHDPMNGHLDYNGRMTQLTENQSGFEFNSSPAAVFGNPDFSRIEDAGLRRQVEKSFADKFAGTSLAAYTPTAQKINAPPAAVVGRVTDPAPTMTNEEAIAFLEENPQHPVARAFEAYISDDYAEINKHPHGEQAQQLTQFVSRLPHYAGGESLYRGMTFKDDSARDAYIQAFAARRPVTNTIYSTSKRSDYPISRALPTAGKPAGLFIEIIGHTSGRDLEPLIAKFYSGMASLETEVAFLRGVQFELVEQKMITAEYWLRADETASGTVEKTTIQLPHIVLREVAQT